MRIMQNQPALSANIATKRPGETRHLVGKSVALGTFDGHDLLKRRLPRARVPRSAASRQAPPYQPLGALMFNGTSDGKSNRRSIENPTRHQLRKHAAERHEPRDEGKPRLT